MGDRDSKFAVEDVENVPSEPSTEHSISSIPHKERPKDGKGPFKYYVIKIVGGWVGLAKCLRLLT